jgi:hypothetical protein
VGSCNNKDSWIQGPYLAGYAPVESPPLTYGLQRLDHAVGNVPNLEKAINYIAKFTGFHEFAEFTAEVGEGVSGGFIFPLLLRLISAHIKYAPADACTPV